MSQDHNPEPLAAGAESSAPARNERHKRNAGATRQRILDAARQEFVEHGLSGARIGRISERAEANIQLIYRYFGSKEDLYVAVLEETYRNVRDAELQLDLSQLQPIEALRRLTGFTFDYLLANPAFVRIMMNENLLEGRFALRAQMIASSAKTLTELLEELISRGVANGTLRRVDPVELYVFILSLCFVHISNKHTLGIMFGPSFSGAAAIAPRRVMVIELIEGFVAAR